jgi:hypothetical protein
MLQSVIILYQIVIYTWHLFIDRHTSVNQIKGYEMDRTCIPVEKKINVYKVLVGIPREKKTIQKT